MMKQTNRINNAFFLLVLGLTLSLGCHAVGNSNRPEQISANQLIGGWRLKTVDNQSPSEINIKSWLIEFSDKQKWTYSGEMTGQYAGMALQGSGTWSINGGLLDYTAGDNKGQTKISIQSDMLILTPDPVV